MQNKRYVLHHAPSDIDGASDVLIIRIKVIMHQKPLNDMHARIVSYNADHYDPLDYSEGKYQYEDTGVENRFALVADIITSLNPDIVLMQEVYGRDQEETESSIRHLAERTGLACEWEGRVTAAKSQHHNLGTGVLWGPRFQPEAYEPQFDFWQPLTALKGSIGGQSLDCASYHGQPVGKAEAFGDRRLDEARRLASFVRRHPHMILGGDWNGAAAVQGPDGWLDPDPDPETPMHQTMTSHEIEFVLNRQAAVALQEHGLIDLAAHYALANNFQLDRTTGSRATREGPQRLDRFYASLEIAKRISSVIVVKNPLTDKAADHYPLVLDLE